ncbi:MAG: thioredoxin-disulfide reductase [Lachnospiraceae bacterium]|nr:thioredoxin-disulfide reductase [Lachnospiraceae bacterium]
MENQKQYDLIIIGSGPAGLSAAIYAQRAKLETLIIEKELMSGGQVVNTYEVENYPGLKGINGFDLAMKFRTHAEELGAVFAEDEVTGIERLETGFKVVCAAHTHEAKAVIVATGATHRKLGVPGEDTFAGKGVSYCATCDGAFFRNKTTAVVGGGDVAVEDAIFLARMCEKVYVIHRRDELRAAKILQERLFALPNVELVWNSTVEQIHGTSSVEELEVKNKLTGETIRLKTDGVFIAVGIVPHSEIFAGLVETDEQGYLIAEEDGKTSVPGIFAAGDVRTKQLRQIVTAASDGANALASVERWMLEQ